MKMFFRVFLPTLFLFLNLLNIFGQRKLETYTNYINKYSSISIDQQKEYKIPASITLSQAILESGAGMSQFVKDSNNHFGIKCHNTWTGGKIYRDDDAKDECFRKYKNAKESFKDHSEFLLKSRYAPLFELDIRDYKAWAKGLQKCGYATDKAYANKLIKLIEDYELYQYDEIALTGRAGEYENTKEEKNNKASKRELQRQDRDVYKTHGLIYVIAKEGDSFGNIAYDLGFKAKDLAKYNEAPEIFPLYKGDIIYLEKKKKKAEKPYYEHIVQIGESMHSISQRYGIRISNLYKMNKKDDEYVPEEGDVLRLR